MKFSISSSELLKQLQIAGGVISSNPVLPILEDFLFSISNNKLTITATDLETSITTELEVMSDSDGMVAVPAKILSETLKALPQQPITFSVNDENFGAEDAVERVRRTGKGIEISLRPDQAQTFGWAQSVAVRIGPGCEDADAALEALQQMLGERWQAA